MRHGRIAAVWVLLAAGIAALGVVGCARQAEDTSVSSIDSTLALGEISGDVPEGELTPGEEFNPPPAAPPPAREPARRPRTSPPPSDPPARSAEPTSATLPAGTAIQLAMQTALTTKTAQVGDRFTARVTQPVIVGNRVAIPEGAVVTGHVAATGEPGKISGRGYMQLAFDELQFDGRSYTIASVGDTVWGKSGAAKDAGMIAGGAAAGAILGKVLGGSGGSAAKGAVIGGAAGTAASLMTRGPQLEIPEGQAVTLSTDRSITVTMPKADA